MKKINSIGIVFILLVTSGFSFSQPLHNFKPGSEPEGFYGIRWGTELLTLKNMKFLKVDPSYGGIDIYVKFVEDSRIGNVRLKNIEYLFWRGKFCGVSVITQGLSEYESLKEALFELFGKGRKPNEDKEYYVWDGESTLMALEFYPVWGKTLYRMMGKTLLNRMELEGK